MKTIQSLAPQNVWKHFYSLTQIPRPSGYMQPVTDFLLNFATGWSRGLRAQVEAQATAKLSNVLPLRR